MKNKHFRKAVVLLSVTFIFFCLAGERVTAQKADTLADVQILYKTVYPGHFAMMEVQLKNQVQIAGFQFMINISNPDLINFHTDSVRVKNIVIPVDTCTWQPESLHYQHPECYKDSIVFAPVRFCHFDTIGSLISGLPNWEVECHGDTADTSLPACKWVEVYGRAKYDTTGHNHPIPPTPDYHTLFRLRVDAFCIPDTTQDRGVSFYMVPQGNSFLSDQLGRIVTFRYNLGQGGQLWLWWARPGDANDDSVVDVGDITFMINYLFRGGSRPCIPEAADCNADCYPEVGDVTTLLNYLFRGGAAPLSGCWHGSSNDQGASIKNQSTEN